MNSELSIEALDAVNGGQSVAQAALQGMMKGFESGGGVIEFGLGGGKLVFHSGPFNDSGQDVVVGPIA